MLRNIMKKSYDLIEKLVRNFTPELKLNIKSLMYLLERKSIEETADYIFNNMRNAQAFQSRFELYDFVVPKASKEGVFLEFGVASGKSINYIASMVNKEIHGFDSFEGFPDDGIIPKPKAPTEKWAGVKWFVGKQKHKVPQVKHNVILHSGWFENTLPEFLRESSDKTAFIHIDCDIYSSTKTIFDNLAERIVPGTIIIFDEYFGYYEWRQNEYKVFQEYVDNNNVSYEYIAYDYSGRAAVKINSIKN